MIYKSGYQLDFMGDVVDAGAAFSVPGTRDSSSLPGGVLDDRNTLSVCLKNHPTYVHGLLKTKLDLSTFGPVGGVAQLSDLLWLR